MFAIFVNNIFKGFWSNNPGEIFFAKTCANLRLDMSQVDLFFYDGIDRNKISEYQIEGESAVLFESHEAGVDELGEAIFNKHYIQVINPMVYVRKGIILKDC